MFTVETATWGSLHTGAIVILPHKDENDTKVPVLFKFEMFSLAYDPYDNGRNNYATDHMIAFLTELGTNVERAPICVRLTWDVDILVTDKS